MTTYYLRHHSQEAFRTGKVAPAAKVTRISRRSSGVQEENREPLDGRQSGEHNYPSIKDGWAHTYDVEIQN